MADRIGSFVVINERMIPAVNIQTDNVPGTIRMPDGTLMWFGVYFEIMFEDGTLWELNEGADDREPHKITVSEYAYHSPDYHNGEPNFERRIDSWDQFITMYDAKLNRR